MCTKSGPQLINSTSLFLRQVDPDWFDHEGEPSSQAFHPWRDIDDGCLSVDQNDITSPADAYTLLTTPPPGGFGMQSGGVWGLSAPEITSAQLTAWEDPIAAQGNKPANPAHALIEFGTLSQKAMKKVGRTLKLKAIARRRLHP